jgi:hypothetical protein
VALVIALHEPKENSDAIGLLAQAMAAGWPGDHRAFASLDVALTITRDRPNENVYAISSLVAAMARGWPSDDRAFASLNAALTIARDRPGENSDAIGHLAEAMAAGWPGEERAFASLDAAMRIARDRPTENFGAIWRLATAMATGWPGDDRAFGCLDKALTIARDRPTESSYAISCLANTMATGWKGDDRALASVDVALTIARDKLKKDWFIIESLSRALATGWPGDDRAFASLDAALKIARDRPKENGYEIGQLAKAIAAGWPNRDFALARVQAALTIVHDEPEENWHIIGGLADAIVAGWRGNDQALSCLDAELRIARDKPNVNYATISGVARAIARGWPGDDRAFASLDAALTIAWDEPEANGSTIWSLAKAIAIGWPGQPNAARCVASVGEVTELNIELWEPWVTLFADEAAIKNWCGERGEKWGLEGDPEFAIIAIPAVSGENGEQKVILIAPRERIRRGLEPNALHQIWQERQPSDFGQQGSHAKRSPKQLGRSSLPHGRIGTPQVRELVRQIAATLGYDAPTLATIVAWTRSKNGTDMMNGAVEVANAVSPDEQAIVPDANPSTGRLSIESADFVTRLSDKAAKKLLAARAAEWANRREVNPWSVSEEDMKNMGSICPGCGRIDKQIRPNKKGEPHVQSPCRSCNSRFSDEAIIVWPEMCKACHAGDCDAATSNVRFAHPPPPEGWKNEARKKECCPQCRASLSRAKRFDPKES